MSDRQVPGRTTNAARDEGQVVTGTHALRGALAVLLLLGAYLTIQPWLTCAAPLGQFFPDAARICMFGSGNPAFDQTGGFSPMWWRLILGAVFVVAGVWVAFTRRLKFI